VLFCFVFAVCVAIRLLNNDSGVYSIDACFAGEYGTVDMRLVSVHVVIRHGDRSPLHTLPNIANKPLNCQLSPPHSDEDSALSEFSRRMERLGHRRVNGSYAGYSLHPNEGHCGLGSLTQIGVQQHIKNGAYLRQAYVKKHNLLDSNDDSIASQVCSFSCSTYGCQGGHRSLKSP